jgi:hypothetical protein
MTFQHKEKTDLIQKNLWRLAEQETLFLMQSYQLTPQEVVRQYTGNSSPQMDVADAINAIYSFNLGSAHRNGFIV